MKQMWRVGVGVLLVLGLSACSFIEVSESAEAVKLATYDEVTHCKKLGFTRTQVLSKIGFIERNEQTMTAELADLARNEAVAMGGDTIVPQAPVEDGKMVFDIYRCR